MKTMDDIYCKQLYGCTPGTYGLDSSAEATSTMRTLQEIYDQVPSFPNQKYQIYDDYLCSANNEESSGACAAGDPEYTGDEATWSLATDSSPPANLDSGKVYRDARTNLYWSDSSAATMTNGFTVDCSDADIISGNCDPCSFAVKGDAISFCCDLALDADGDGTDETDWRLPSLKEFMQAKVNGAANALPSDGWYHWTSTEAWRSSDDAWIAEQNYTYDNDKTIGGYASNYVRCVRP